MVRQAVLLTAGLSTRTYPLTVRKPKPLLKLANTPNLMHLLRGLAAAGVRTVVLVVGFEREQVQRAIGHRFAGLTVHYAVQDQPLGTGHAVLQAAPLLNGAEPFAVLNGDDLILPDALAACVTQVPALLVAPHHQPYRFGVVEVADGFVRAVREKPKEVPPGALVSTGAWALPGEALQWLQHLTPAEDGEIRLPDITPQLVAHGLRAVVTDDGWVPLTYPWDVLIATRHLLALWNTERVSALLPAPAVSGSVHPTAEVHGDVFIAPTARVEAGAKVIGPAMIGEGSVIGANCDIVRTVVGDHCHIGDGAHLEDCVLMDQVQVGADAELAWSVLGDRVVVGNAVRVFAKVPSGITVRSVVRGQLVDTGMAQLGCIVGDGARIGDRCVLYPGVKVWNERVVLPRTEVLEDVR